MNRDDWIKEGFTEKQAKKLVKNGEYWRKRFELLEEAQNKAALETYAEIEHQFRIAQKEIESKISLWYTRFAKNNKISMAEAQKWLTKKELDEFRWTVKEYIEHLDEQVTHNPIWSKQLENASARFHISRLEALKLQIQQTMEKLFGNQLDSIDYLLKKNYLDGYYHTIYELQKGFNIGWDIAAIDERQLKMVLSKPWTADNQTFSTKIWKDKQTLINKVHTQLSQNIILGKSPIESINQIEKLIGETDKKGARFKASRLVMTESAYFSNAAQKDAFNELEVEQYEIVETLDSVTCTICGAMDGKHFPMSQFEAGVTTPPFHPFCRGCTAPYFDDDLSIGKRVARDSDGKKYYVDGNMTYKEWKEKFVVENKGVSGVVERANGDKNTYIIPTDKNIDILSVSDRLEPNKNIFNTADGESNTIIISRKNLENIYPALNENEINYVMAAHKTVLEHGLKNKTEMFLAFDKSSGKIVLQKIGTKDEIKFKTSELTKAAKDSIIFIHNHPSGSAFSPADFNTLNALESLKYMGIQGHNGEIYSLSVGDGMRFKKEIKNNLQKYFEAELDKLGHSIHTMDRLNKNIATSFEWKYKKE